ncbi:MAG: hypothetical protein MI802_03350 [Desulfobacterales bacterium]|nr:hypothetical protein [Desulfobacterales bacterium]
MVNKEIFDIANQLQSVIEQQMQQAQKALVNLPDSDVKRNLESLLQRASKGKVSYQDAQREMQTILKNAG